MTTTNFHRASQFTSAVIARAGGRSSIPEPARFDHDCRGVLDHPPARV